MKATLRFVYRKFVPIHLAPRTRKIFFLLGKLIEKSAVQTDYIFLKDRTIPYWSEDATTGALRPKPLYDIFDERNISTARKDGFEFPVGHLKYAEGAVFSAVDDLNVLHDYSAACGSACGFQRSTGLRAAAVSSRRRRGARRGAPSKRAV